VNAALTRYRVIAWIVGVFLLIVVFVATPLTLTGRPTVGSIVGPIHGVLYMAYCVFAFHLGVKSRWPLKYTVLVLLAGTIPFLSFVAERNVTRRVRGAVSPSAGPAPADPRRASSRSA
jgi:integral membrane protein